MYASENETGHDKINQQRYDLLGQQLSIYKKDQVSWSIWLYKDIGFQGESFGMTARAEADLRFRDELRKP